MTPEEKAKIKAAFAGEYKILTAALCRIYYAHPDPQQWTFSGLQGGLALVADRMDAKAPRWLKVVDLAGTRGVVWKYELYDGFKLTSDLPFFQSFDACVSG